MGPTGVVGVVGEGFGVTGVVYAEHVGSCVRAPMLSMKLPEARP